MNENLGRRMALQIGLIVAAAILAICDAIKTGEQVCFLIGVLLGQLIWIGQEE